MAGPALLLENLPLLRAFGRSRRLVSGSWWRIFGITLLTSIIVGVASSAVQFPASLIGSIVAGGGLGTGSPSSASVPMVVLGQLVTGLGALVAGSVLYPFQASVNALMYIDLRMRREGLDVDLMRAADPGPGEPHGRCGGADPGPGSGLGGRGAVEARVPGSPPGTARPAVAVAVREADAAAAVRRRRCLEPDGRTGRGRWCRRGRGRRPGWRRFGGAGAARRHREGVFTASAMLSAAEHRRLAEAAEHSERWAVAVLERFRAIARELEERTLLSPAPGRTADEVAAEASRALPALSDRLSGGARWFDDVVYGDRPATAQAAALLRELDEAVCSAKNESAKNESAKNESAKSGLTSTAAL